MKKACVSTNTAGNIPRLILYIEVLEGNKRVFKKNYLEVDF